MPRRALAQLSTNIHGLGQTTLGLVVFAMASNRADLDWIVAKVSIVGTILTSSMVTTGAINFLAKMIASGCRALS